MTNTIQTAGKDIRVGNMLKTWFGMQRVVSLTPYVGPVWAEGQAAVASLDSGKSITIARNDWLEVVPS